MAVSITKGIIVQMVLPLRWLVLRSTSAIALWPFILIRPNVERTPELIHHERIHLQQQLELLLIFFYLFYLVEYIFYRSKGFSHNKAYLSLSFEKEAFGHQSDIDYLKKRPLFAMWR